MLNIIKRNGTEVAFDGQKIINAITKAFEATGTAYDRSVIDQIALKAATDFGTKVHDGKISVEDIQDSVEKAIADTGYANVAKSYILYRQQHAKMRDVNSTMLNYKKLVDGYLGVADWRVKENSTVTYSLGGLILGNSGAITANYWLSEVYDDEIAEAHRSAAIHLHDLSMLSGYCFTGDTRVRTHDGENPTFKEMVDRGQKEVFLYAFDRDQKKVVATKGINPRITRSTDELMEVSLSNGVILKCTPDHLFMLKNGEYREARFLAPNTVLKAMLEDVVVVKAELFKLDQAVEVYDLTVPGYENFAVEGNVFVHNCAGWSLKQLIQEGLGGVPGKITSSPAAHLSTLCNQMVNFLGILQNEWAG